MVQDQLNREIVPLRVGMCAADNSNCQAWRQRFKKGKIETQMGEGVVWGRWGRGGRKPCSRQIRSKD